MFDITRKFTVHLEGRGDLAVKPSDHIASGGEGHVYRPGNGSLALKVWDDPSRAIVGQMPERITLLIELKHPGVVAPTALARDNGGTIIGYVMPWVTGWDLPVAFTNDWRASHNFDDAEALAFANTMREIAVFTHSHNIVMGDANELNILGANNQPKYIDVDPWLPPGFSGDKIMPTVQDWHSKPFSKEADWFAWGVVTFQLLTGIHPYRGSHPDFKRGDLEGRMKANASVFDPSVRLNAAVRPLTNIPTSLLSWYQEAFQRGVRSIPPEARMTSTIQPVVGHTTITTATGALKVIEAFKLKSPFARIVAPDTLMLADGSLIGLPDGRLIGRIDPKHSVIRDGSSLIATQAKSGMVSFQIIRPGDTRGRTDSGISADAVWSASNRLFGVVRDGLIELAVRNLGSRYMMSADRRWSFNPNTTVLGKGASVYDALGAKYLIVPQVGKAVAVIRARELDKTKPVSIVANGCTAIVAVVDQDGSYHRVSFSLDASLLSYKAEITPADDGSLTDIILDNGIVLWTTTNGELGVSANGTTSTYPLGEASGGRLISGPSGVFCVAGNKLFRLSLGSP